MRYEKSDRIQGIEQYCCVQSFMSDVIETLIDGENGGQVNIIADDFITGELIKTICRIDFDGFMFDIQDIEFSKVNEVTEYIITLLDDGEVYVGCAKDKNGKYLECDGFIYLSRDISSDAIMGNNRKCDAMIFQIDEFEDEGVEGYNEEFNDTYEFDEDEFDCDGNCECCELCDDEDTFNVKDIVITGNSISLDELSTKITSEILRKLNK